ncbi:MAG: hypothetical protein ABI844_07820 [Saprospiraceae bacterium]
MLLYFEALFEQLNKKAPDEISCREIITCFIEAPFALIMVYTGDLSHDIVVKLFLQAGLSLSDLFAAIKL